MSFALKYCLDMTYRTKIIRNIVDASFYDRIRRETSKSTKKIEEMFNFTLNVFK